jgi:hypothetical protein
VATAGQLLAVGGLLLLHVAWFSWWWDYPGGGVGNLPTHGTTLTRFAKTMGHVNDLDMSLLLLLGGYTALVRRACADAQHHSCSWAAELGRCVVVVLPQPPELTYGRTCSAWATTPPWHGTGLWGPPWSSVW